MSTSLAALDNKKFETALGKFKKDAALIVVDSPESCLTAKTMQRDVRNYIKDAKSALDPFVNMAKRTYDDARDERSKWIDPAELIDTGLAAKVKDFERKERERTEREAAEHNRLKREAEAREADRLKKEAQAKAEEERKARQKEIDDARKAGDLNKREAERMKKQAEEEARQKCEQAAEDSLLTKANFTPDRVLPNIPTVSGVPSRRNYKFRVIDVDRVPRSYMCPDLVKIGSDVRNWKRVGEVIPGIEAYEE